MSTRTKTVDRNVHTGEKLQSKQNSDAYRDNFDKIFGKRKDCIVPAVVYPLVEGHAFTHKPPVDEEYPQYEIYGIPEFIKALGEASLSPYDGSGYYGIGHFESTLSCFNITPKWADCVYWYNK